jgi:hypothetical protein
MHQLLHQFGYTVIELRIDYSHQLYLVHTQSDETRHLLRELCFAATGAHNAPEYDAVSDCRVGWIHA